MRLKILFLLLAIPGMSLAQGTPPSDTASQSNPVIDLVDQQLNNDNIPTVSINDNDLNDGGSQNVSSILTAGRDPFFSSAIFNFSAARFKIRGYDNDNYITYMNGVPMDQLDNGFTSFFLWSGLNDVIRNRDNSLGLKPNTFAFGEIGGSFNIDTRASKQWKQLRVSYASTNRNYSNRLMATYSTGLLKSGWAFSGSISRRWAKEGYVPGTFYDSWSYYAAAEKVFNDRHSLSLVTLGTPTKNGRAAASIKELQDLSGTNYYNPLWGYQNGEKRNSSVAQTHQPTFILTHDFKINNTTSLVTAGSYTFGRRAVTAIDWYNAADPRADYYRNLPSAIDDTAQSLEVEALIRANPELIQVQWDKFYEVNRNSIETIQNANGIQGNNVTGKRARYIVENRISDVQRMNFNSVLNKYFKEHYSLTTGISYQFNKTSNYKEVDDLLGADFYVDLNQFAERDFPSNSSANQNDLNNPNRILEVGDKFGYNYDVHLQKGAAWGQILAKYNKVDVFAALELSVTSYFRDGKVKNGLFPENSFGKSEVLTFFNYGLKGGVTYKVNGRNYVYANGSYTTRAPYFDNVFVSPRTRNTTVPDPKSETVRGVEAGYVLNSPRIKARLSGYFTQFLNQTNTLTFFHDDFRSFVNYSLTNIDKIHMGGELGIDAKIYKGLSAVAAVSMGRFYYTSRQNAFVTQDNSQEVLAANETIYSKNYKVSGTPQFAYTTGLSYRSPKFWFINVNFNYFDDIWLDYNPIRRTQAAVDLQTPGSDIWNDVLAQEKVSGQFTMDVFAGYSWKLDKTFNGMKKSTYLYFNLGVNNITNNKDFITGGFEQLRFDFDDRRVDKFPNRYSYAFGINYFASVTFRM